MTRGSPAVAGGSNAARFCVCCGAKMTAHFVEDAVASRSETGPLISESFLTVKGAALFLPRGNGSSHSSTPYSGQQRNKHAGDLRQHLQTMFTLLRPEDNIRLAVRLESARPQCTRYMVVVTTNGRQDTEESVVLGIDFSSSNSSCTVGLVLPLWSDTRIHLDGDGGFSVCTVNRVHVFKPVSVQAMWAALQSLHKACEVSRCHNYYPGSLFLTWVSYYHSHVASDQSCINEWNAMQDLQSHRSDSPVLFNDMPTERERTERLIKARLREIMMQKDLENVTSKEIRTELEMQMACNLREFKEFIDNEMIVILGQMDSPTEIFDHVYLGSEWNASNLEELQSSGVRFILNVTREIDNFFPGLFEYHNIRVYDEEATDLLAYWNDTYKFISKAKKAGAKCLVHCKMGVSRSASTVIAYAMKEYGWNLERAFDHVKERRTVAKPNPSFMRQLEEYQGILLASKQRHNKLWRSHSDSDLSERQESPTRTPHTLGRSDPHNDTSQGPLSLQHFLDNMNMPRVVPPTRKSLDGSANSGDSLPLSLPRPQAATVVPEEGLDCTTAMVAESVLVGRPHPPPVVHLLSPSAVTTQDGTGLQAMSECASGFSTTVPEQTCTSNSEQSVSVPMCQTIGHAAQVPERGSPNRPLLGPTNDHMNNPQVMGQNGIQTPAAKTPPPEGPTSPPGTDSIDFFRAREKFLGLSQRIHSFLEQAPLQMPHLKNHALEPQLLHPEDLLVTPASALLEEDDKVLSPVVDSSGHDITQRPHVEKSQPLLECAMALPLKSPGLYRYQGEEEDTEAPPPSGLTPPLMTWQLALGQELDSQQSPDCIRDTECIPLVHLPGKSYPLLESASLDQGSGGAVVEALAMWEGDTEGGVGMEEGMGQCEEWFDQEPLLTMHRYTGDIDASALSEAFTPAPSDPTYMKVMQLDGVTETETDTDGPFYQEEQLEDAWETLRELGTCLCEETEPEQAWVQTQEMEISSSPVKRSVSLNCLHLSDKSLSPLSTESCQSELLSISDPQLHNPPKDTLKLCVSPPGSPPPLP